MSANLNFHEKLRAVPLLRALVPMVAGIVVGPFVAAIPLYVWIACAVICTATAWPALSRRSVFSTLYVVLAIVFFGAALARAHSPQSVVPQGERVWMEILLTDSPSTRGGRRSASNFGTVIRWQPDNLSGNFFTGEWQPAGERLLVSIDTMWNFEAGDRVIFRGYVNPVSDTADSYSRLMRARGYTGRTYISQYSHPETAPGKTKSPVVWAKKLQSAATERLRRLGGNENIGRGNATENGLETAETAIVTNRMNACKNVIVKCKNVMAPEISVAAAMTTGDRSGITPELRRAYSRTGASHLLAVSGLHVGIIFMIINILLYLLPLFPHGHIVKNIVAIVAIWSYAVLTGLSPSATRAAFMFTGAQIALATSQTRGATNIMCGTALVMLAVKPGLLFDISFQLSFIAVAAILAWFAPLYRLVESRFKLLNALWAALIVGLVASAATMPLVSYTFGVFSPAGIVLNPLIITTAHLTIIFSLLWIAAPFAPLEPLFRWLVGGPVWLQNRVVELTSAVPGAAIEWTMPGWMVFALYAAIIIFTARFAGRSRETEPFVLPR